MLVNRSVLAVFCLCALAHAQGTVPPDQIIYSFDPTFIDSPVAILVPEAKMPDEARRQHLDGICAVTFVVNRKGLPQDPRIVRCTDSLFAENSLNAVKKYRFVPAKRVADNKPVLFRMHMEVDYKISADPNPVPLPQPRIKGRFFVPSKSAPSGPDSNGIYTLSHDFDPPNSFPQIKQFGDAGFGRAAFSFEDGAGCIAILTLDEKGHPTDAQITECDDASLENPILRSLRKSQYSSAILNGRPVPVRASVRIVCEGFGLHSEP